MANPEWVYGIPSISVVGDGFCVPYPVDLIVKRKFIGLSDAHFDVLDVSGNLFLQVDGSLWQLQRKRIMRDPAGFPILTMREKVLTSHHRWTVHRGESSDATNLLFSVQKSHSLQIKTQLDVFLASNVNEDNPQLPCHWMLPFLSLSKFTRQYCHCRGERQLQMGKLLQG
ncbi:hypothetical protein F0562_026205 [Nyssa sinensis]|uniref:Uncharacterized protein n=1 Tax=Nyssa sinensis TaxID=561372 RepID=A0A5J5B8K5_9ASTE|nr:hypothetical protein F0562_026205 [Nyssa sinensis]